MDMKLESPFVLVMVGLPGVGKSTWLKNNGKPDLSCMVVSSDYYIDQAAADLGKTYNEVFERSVKKAQKLADYDADEAMMNELNVFWDQTNLSIKKRKKILDMFPVEYHRYAVYFCLPEYQEWMRRLNSRPGKTIPEHILMNMKKSMEVPSPSEGFDSVFIAIDGEICQRNNNWDQKEQEDE